MPIFNPNRNKVPKEKKFSTTKEERMKYYNRREWWSLRKAKLISSPLCEVCQGKNIITLAEEVHHIRSPFKVKEGAERAELFFSFDNLQSICKKCHGSHHKHEQIQNKNI